MKLKFILLIFFVFTAFVNFSQTVPQGINYQAIARDASNGQVLASKAITVKFKLYNSLSAPIAYEENHSLTTNEFGYFNTIIGNGSTVSGSFASVSFSTGTVAYEVYIDGNLLGSKTGFLSVPYALYAISSGSGSSSSINISGAGITNVTGISPNFTVSTPAPTLAIASGSLLSISGGNTVTIPSASGWSLLGNSGTNPPTNYIGTQDLKDLVFKTNGNERIRVMGTGQVGIGNSSPSHLFESQTGTGVNLTAGRFENTNTTNAQPTFHARSTSTAGRVGVFESLGLLNTENAVDVYYHGNASGLLIRTYQNLFSSFKIDQDKDGHAIHINAPSVGNNSEGVLIQYSGLNNGLKVLSENTASPPEAIVAISKGIGSTSGAIYAETQGATSAPAIKAKSNIGNGPAIEAYVPVSGSSNVGLLLSDSHLSTKSSGGASVSSSSITSDGTTDVAGRLITYAEVEFPGESYTTVTVSVGFSKNYSYAPFVTLTPLCEEVTKVRYWISNVTTSGFEITMSYDGMSYITIPSSTKLFSYHVIGLD